MVSLRRKGERAARSAQQGSDILGRTPSRAAKARSILVLPSRSLKCPPTGPVSGIWEPERTLAPGRLRLEGRLGHYNLVDVSLFIPLRWAKLDDSTGSSLGACGALFRAK